MEQLIINDCIVNENLATIVSIKKRKNKKNN
jgi:hypothetical protein